MSAHLPATVLFPSPRPTPRRPRVYARRDPAASAAAASVGRVVRRPLAAKLARSEVARHRPRVLRPPAVARPFPVVAVDGPRAALTALAGAVRARPVGGLAEH